MFLDPHLAQSRGVSGRHRRLRFIARMRVQAEQYGAEIILGRVEQLERSAGGGFTAVLADGSRHEAKRVLLATGTEDVPPPLALPERKQAVQQGRLRYCPICDAYEVRGLKLALAGSRRCRIHEACCCAATRPISP